MGAGITRIKAGQAFIELTSDHEKFMKGVDRIQSRMRRFASNINRIGRSLTIGGGAITGAFIPFMSTVADAETAMRRFQLIFGNATGEMRKQLQLISRETGIALTPLIEQSSSFAAIFGQLRDVIGGRDFTRLIGNVQRQVLNLAALSGLSLPEAADRMRSAFTSTGESVDQFGLNLRQAEVNAEAQRLGLNKNVRQMSEMEKQLVKLSIIQRSMNSMNIEFIDMVDTLNGQITLFRSNLRELAVVAGEETRKSLVELFRSANKFLVNIRETAKELSPAIKTLGMFGVGLLSAGLTLQGIALAGRALAWAFKPFMVMAGWIAQGGFTIVIANISRGLGLLAVNIQNLTASLLAMRLSLAALGPIVAGAAFQRVGAHDAVAAGAAVAENRIYSPKVLAAINRARARTTDLGGPAPGEGAGAAVAQARGTFRGGLIAQQMAFGTVAAADRTANATEGLLELAREVLARGPGGSKVKVGTAAG